MFMTACNTIIPIANNEKSEILEATYEKPSDSPDGKHRLVVLTGNDGEARYMTFQILRNSSSIQKKTSQESGEINSEWLTVYTSTNRFPARFVNRFLWDAENRVWAYNSDIGSYFYWQSDSRNQWKKNIYLDQAPVSRPPLPPLLQRNYDDVQNKIKKSSKN